MESIMDVWRVSGCFQKAETMNQTLKVEWGSNLCLPYYVIWLIKLNKPGMMMVRPALKEMATLPKCLSPCLAQQPGIQFQTFIPWARALYFPGIFFKTQLLLGGVTPPIFSALTWQCEVIYKIPFFWRCSLEILFKRRLGFGGWVKGKRQFGCMNKELRLGECLQCGRHLCSKTFVGSNLFNHHNNSMFLSYR